MATPGDDDVEIGLNADLNEQSVVRAAERMGQIFGAIMGGEGGDAGRAFTTGFERAFRSANLGKGAFRTIEREAEAASRSVRFVADSAGRVSDQFNQMGAAGRRAVREINADELNRDLAALQDRVEGTRATLTSLGANTSLFAVVDRELEQVLRRSREFNENIEAISRDDSLLEGYAESFRQSRRIISGELDASLRLLINFKENDRAEKTRILEQEKVLGRERVAALRASSSRYVVETQGAEARLLAETRNSGREQLAAQQANARARIEIIRFTFRQIQTLERGIAGVFRATGTVATSAFRALSSAVNRTGNLFRRSNRDLNDGLNGALTARERSIVRSFGRQTREIQAETTRQARAIEKLERQASTGVLGALTGRSRLGGAVGAGALIGGGFTSANLFSAGLDRFQSLERANLQLERILGSATAARRQLDSLNEWAQGTPLALDLVTEIAVGLLSMGTAADQVLPRLEAITDVVAFAGGGSEEIRRVSLAIRQVASAGRLLGQDFNQIAQALPGVNLAKLLADELTGGDTAELLKLRESGEISANEFITAFVAGIQNDPRIGGSTASLSATLSGQISNLNAAWRRLGAAIITEFEGPIRAAIKRLRDNLSLLARFISGDVSPAFQALRSAIAGVAVALGVLIAARTAVQIIQLLGVAAQFALTPMGALVTAFVAIGAAVGALRSTSDTFRYITDGIRDLASDSLSRGLSLLVEALRRLGGFLAETVAPAVANLARVVFPALIFAVRVLVAVVRAVLIPAVQAGFGFFIDTAIPAALRLADALSQYLLPAVLALSAAWFVFNAPLGVVVVAVTALATALIILRRESLSVRDFTDSLGESFLNLGRKLASIGSAAGSAALTVLSALGETLSTLFSRINYRKLAVDILRFVNEVGRLLGRAITSRVAVTAGIAIGTAAVALAGSFLVGFAEGVITGLPGAIDTILDAIRLGLRELGAPSFFTSLFKNSFTGIAAVLAAAFLASSVLRAMSRAGAGLAAATTQGFVSRIRAGAGNARQIAIGLFGGPGALERQAEQAARRTQAAYLSEFQRANRELRGLGQKLSLIPKGGVTEQALKDINARLTETRTRFGEAGANAALFRDRTERAFSGFRKVVTAPMAAFSGSINDGVVQARVGIKNIAQAFGDGFARLTAQGRITGQALGGAVLSGFGAVISGQQLGSGNKLIGLSGIIASAIGASVATGSPAIGAAVGGIGLLTAAFQASGEAARIAAGKIEGYADTIINAGSVTAAQADLVRTIVDEISNLDIELQRSVSDFNVGAFVDRIAAGADPASAAFAQLGVALGIPGDRLVGLTQHLDAFNSSVNQIDLADEGHALIDLDNALKDTGISVDEFLTLFQAFAGEGSAIRSGAEQAAVSLSLINNEVERLREGLGPIDAGFFADVEARAVKTAEEVTGLSRLLQFESVANAVSRVTGLIDRVGDIGVDAFEAIQMELAGTGVVIDNELTRFIRDLIDEWIRLGLETDQAKRFMKIDQGFFADMEAMGGSARNLGEAFDDMGEDAAEAAQEVDLIGAAFRELETQRSTKIRAQITAIQDQLEAAQGAAERARDALTAFITGRYADTARAQVDALIGNISSIGSAIEDALLQGGVRGDAALRSAVGGFESQLAGIIQAGFDDGLRTQEQFRTLLAPLFAAVDEEAGDAAGRILSTVDFTEGITPEAGREIAAALQRAIGGNNLEVAAGAIMSAESEVERLQAQLDAAQASLEVDVAFSGDQVRAALQAAFDEAGLSADQRAFILGQVTDQSVAASQQGALAQAVAPTQQNITIQDNSQQVVQVTGAGNPQAVGAAVIRENRVLATGRRTPSIYADVAV
jgi:tape measure domain-containing protein